MIDARADLAGAVAEIQANVATLTSSLTAALPGISLSIVDIAKLQAVSKSTVYREPWRLPQFGQKPDASAVPARWLVATYLSWMQIPEATRRRDWELMPAKQRRAIKANVA